MFINSDHHTEKVNKQVITNPGFDLDAAWFFKGQNLGYRKVSNTYGKVTSVNLQKIGNPTTVS